jgi:hypothetical protein
MPLFDDDMPLWLVVVAAVALLACGGALIAILRAAI